MANEKHDRQHEHGHHGEMPTQKDPEHKKKFTWNLTCKGKPHKECEKEGMTHCEYEEFRLKVDYMPCRKARAKEIMGNPVAARAQRSGKNVMVFHCKEGHKKCLLKKQWHPLDHPESNTVIIFKRCREIDATNESQKLGAARPSQHHGDGQSPSHATQPPPGPQQAVPPQQEAEAGQSWAANQPVSQQGAGQQPGGATMPGPFGPVPDTSAVPPPPAQHVPPPTGYGGYTTTAYPSGHSEFQNAPPPPPSAQSMSSATGYGGGTRKGYAGGTGAYPDVAFAQVGNTLPDSPGCSVPTYPSGNFIPSLSSQHASGYRSGMSMTDPSSQPYPAQAPTAAPSQRPSGGRTTTGPEPEGSGARMVPGPFDGLVPDPGAAPPLQEYHGLAGAYGGNERTSYAGGTGGCQSVPPAGAYEDTYDTQFPEEFDDGGGSDYDHGMPPGVGDNPFDVDDMPFYDENEPMAGVPVGSGTDAGQQSTGAAPVEDKTQWVDAENMRFYNHDATLAKARSPTIGETGDPHYKSSKSIWQQTQHSRQ